MKRTVLIICTLIVALSGCKKKEFPENIATEPEFYISANIDGQTIKLNAGTMNYYMFSNYTQNADGLYSFIAELKQQNCNSNCPNSLRFDINDDQISTQGAASNIHSSIKPATYEYVNTSTVNPTVIGYAVTFSSSCNLPVDGYEWNFGYGPQSYSANPTHTYATAGIYNTKFTVSTSSPAAYTDIQNPIKVTTNPNAVRTRVIVTSVIGNKVHFSCASTTGTVQGNYQWLWDFGDGTITSPDETPDHTYNFAGIYKVTLRVIDSQVSDTAYHSYLINTQQSNQLAPNFYPTSVTEILSNTPLKKIKITYTDGSGNVYTSDMQPQNGTNNNFQITSVEEYKNNEKGQPTKKLKIKFACRLYNSSSFVDITDGEAVIAVAYR